MLVEIRSHISRSITNSLFSRMLFHLRETRFAHDSTSRSFGISSIVMNDILQHLGSDPFDEEPCARDGFDNDGLDLDNVTT